MTKPPKSLRHHIKDININANDVIKSDIDKYKNHPLIQPLNITEVEFKKYGALIKRIIREEETCAANPNDCYLIGKQHLRLIRDSNNKLTPIFIPCEKTAQLTNIKEHYLIHSFGTDYFKVRIAKAFFNKVDKTKADLLNLYKRYIDKKSIEHGIYLYGDMGIGKTYTSIALANEMANLGFKIAFVFLPDIIYELKQGFSHENNNNDEIMHKMMMADILFLDDFGAERSSAWFYKEHLLIILNYRMQNHKLTFFNSNLSMADAEQKIGNLIEDKLNAKRLMERVRALTNNTEYKLIGVNKRY